MLLWTHFFLSDKMKKKKISKQIHFDNIVIKNDKLSLIICIVFDNIATQ